VGIDCMTRSSFDDQSRSIVAVATPDRAAMPLMLRLESPPSARIENVASTTLRRGAGPSFWAVEVASSSTVSAPVSTRPGRAGRNSAAIAAPTSATRLPR
jgi:hypothetical protein